LESIIDFSIGLGTYLLDIILTMEFYSFVMASRHSCFAFALAKLEGFVERMEDISAT